MAGKTAGKATRSLGGIAHKAVSAVAKSQWSGAAGVLGVLVVLAIAVFRSCSGFGVPSAGSSSPVSALPDTLRASSSCQRYDANGTQKCVVAPGSPLLVGSITGGRELTYYVQVDPKDRLSATIARWRGSGGTILSDTTVFLEIGPSDTVWYADTRTGFHLETGTFASQSDAQAFLIRSGLSG